MKRKSTGELLAMLGVLLIAAVGLAIVTGTMGVMWTVVRDMAGPFPQSLN